VKGLEWAENSREYILIMEYMNNAEYFKEKIDQNLSPVKSEEKLKSYASDILECLAYLHGRGIVHGDIKLENLLVHKFDGEKVPIIKVCDFGLSSVLDKKTGKFLMTIPMGSVSYMAPEITSNCYLDEKIDMWALGVITYFLLCGYTPFDRQNSMDEMHAILNAEYQFAPIEYWQGVSETAKSFVNGLLTTDPSHRMTAAQALKHPWLAQSGLNQDGQTAQAPQDQDTEMEGPHDLLPSMMSRIKARTKFRNAVGAVKAINSMRKRHEELRVVHQEDVEQVLHRGDEEMV